MNGLARSRQKLELLRTVLTGHKNLLIVMQDYPDPDAIAAASGLRQVVNSLAGLPCTIAYGGGIGRAENRMLAKYTGHNLWRLESVDLNRFDLISMVDTQPASGNNSLPHDRLPDIVIDHHPMRGITRSVPFTDIRSRYGATSAIIYEYLKASEIKIEVPLATALVYGIRSDTQNFGRESTQADMDAYLSLYPVANKRMLSRIEHATVPRSYFQFIASALTRARIYGPGILCGLGELEHPDVLSEIADLLLRNEESTIVLVYGIHESRLILSMRCTDVTAEAAQFMHRIVGSRGTGGGHSTFAGGQIPLKTKQPAEINELTQLILRRFLKLLKVDAIAVQPLVQLL